MPKIAVVLIIFLSSLFFYRPVFADQKVLINEVLADPSSDQKEWVELYFPQEPFDVSSYILKDKVGTSKSLASIKICGNFAAWELTTSSGEGWLNNTGEESVFLYDGANNKIDSFENWTSPGEGKTIGRIPNGTDNWQNAQTPTFCQQNSQAVPTPTPTPTPTPENSTSQSSSTSTSSPTPTPKSSSTTTTTKSPSPKSVSSPAVLGESEADPTSQSLLDMQQSSPSPSPSPEATSLSKTRVAGMLVGSGIMLLGLSVGFYLWYKKILRSSPPERMRV